MDAASLLARLVLVATFAVAAATKLRDREGVRSAVAAFGVPSSLREPVAELLGPAEVTSAALLLTAGVGVLSGAALAALLLATFTVGIVAHLIRGNRVPCRCFGAASSAPVSWWSVARNGVLLVAALVVVAAGPDQLNPGRTAADVLDPLQPALRWLWVVVALLTVAVVVLGGLFVALLRRHGEVLLRLDEIAAPAPTPAAVRTPAPATVLLDTSGGQQALADLLAPQGPTLLVFVSPGCAACVDLVPHLNTWQRRGEPVVLVVSPGPRGDIEAKFGRLMVWQHYPAVADAFGVEFTPAAVVIDDGMVNGPPVYGADELRRLHASLSRRGGPADVVIGPPPLRVGDPLPSLPVRLPDDDGRATLPFDQAVQRLVGGRDAVVLLWDTTCQYCAVKVDDIKRRQDLVRMVMLLPEDQLDALRGSGITAPAVLDPDFAVGAALQMPGTPSAFRVREGVVASPVVAGGPDVVDLLAVVRVSP